MNDFSAGSGPRDEPPAGNGLFDEFPPTSTDEWEAQIRNDLSGRAYDKMLLWHPFAEVTVRPYYRAEDLAELAHLCADLQTVIASPSWSIRQDVTIGDVEMAARRMEEAVRGGVGILGLDLSTLGRAPLSERVLHELLGSLDLENTTLHVEAGIHSLSRLDEVADRTEQAATAAFDPFSELARTGRFSERWMDEAAAAVEDRSSRVLRAAADPYHDAGGDLVEETAFMLAAVSEYLVRLTHRGASIEQILGRLSISLPVGTSFFPEIARLRAVRLLIPQLVAAFDGGAAAPDVPIHASVSRRSMTLYDPHTNLLRSTTAAAAAVLGGCDILNISAFDALGGGPSNLGCRLARNIQHLLRHEAHLDKVGDPGSGSYYVEVLTDAVARSVWTLFKQVESKGGLLAATRSGMVGSRLTASRQRLFDEVARRDRILVGTNQYPNPDEHRLEEAAGGADRTGPAPDDPGERISEPLRPRRAADEIEQLRLRTERHEAVAGRRPTAAILPVGDPVIRSDRARFASNFLGCAGLDIREAEPVERAEDALTTVRETPSDLLVIAGPNEVYTHHLIHDLKQSNRFRAIGIVARTEAVANADFWIYGDADMRETLAAVQDLLGMKEDA